MSPERYKERREALGTQAEVAEVLGITRETLNRREMGKAPINGEAASAMLYLTDNLATFRAEILRRKAEALANRAEALRAEAKSLGG